MPLIPPPAGLTLRPLGHWELRTTTPTPGIALDGLQQYIHRENRVWRNRYQVLGSWFNANQDAYLAWLDDLKGPANTFNLPICNRGMGTTAILFATEGGDFLTDTGDFLVWDGGPEPTVLVTAPAGATLLQLSSPDGELVDVGLMFTVNGFAYRVAANTAGTIRVNPPLREAITSGTAVNFISPQITVKLDGDGAASQAHQFSQIGAPQVLSVIEAFDR